METITCRSAVARACVLACAAVAACSMHGTSSPDAGDDAQVDAHLADADADADDGSLCGLNPETCDGRDEDCDGTVDEGLPLLAWYIDRDNDRRGDSDAEAVQSCGAISGYSAYNDDCDDNDRAIRPTVTEICNGFDDDCDTLVDENVSVLHFADLDGDGRGAGAPVAICAGTPGYAQFDDDCNDNNPDISPQRLETCDALDNDCDTIVDEALGCPL